MFKFTETGIRSNNGGFLTINSIDDLKSFVLTAEEIRVLHEIYMGWTPEKYCADYFAVDKFGKSVDAGDTQAVRWCIQGYLCKVTGLNEFGDMGDAVLFDYLYEAAYQLYDDSIKEVNDGPDGHNKVRNLVKTVLEYQNVTV